MINVIIKKNYELTIFEKYFLASETIIYNKNNKFNL